jgi:hypothetical protein
MTHQPSSFDDELGKLTDDARRAEATRTRRQRSDRSVTAALSGTFAGTLTEVGEAQTPVAILTRNGGHLRGTIASVGPDVVVVQPAARTSRVLLHLDAIEGIRCGAAELNEDIHASAEYRAHLVGVMAARAIAAAVV